ncbi:MAG TPA: hypothetical protein VJI98_02895 [Candidatus Nanoarchaeia archaeon]|nr:hypothetical protein [Candidatus Nanoarchaeia archaeon]
MKRFLLDTSIYGEIIFDENIRLLADNLKQKAVVHGFKVIREELRQTLKSIVYNGDKIRLIVNEINNLRNPSFIGYLKLKRLLI